MSVFAAEFAVTDEMKNASVTLNTDSKKECRPVRKISDDSSIELKIIFRYDKFEQFITCKKIAQLMICMCKKKRKE